MEIAIPGFHLPMTAASGQCFRFDKLEDGAFSLIAHGRQLLIHDLGSGAFELSCTNEEFESLWRGYFDLDRDYHQVHGLVAPDGSYLHRAVEFAKGVRILRQQPFETLIAFIISQRKNIPAIKACVSQLSRRFGQEISPGAHAFPTPAVLAAADDAELAACGLGYRVKYVKQTAGMVAEGAIDLDEIGGLDDEELKARLLRFPGVGVKVAACVMLFAYARMDAFPVDVWIEKVFREQFPQGFPYEHYRGAAGILQQYLFCFIRHEAGRAQGR